MKPFDVRGVMLDPARLLETRALYRELIPMLADWGYNTLFWHFADDQGCALRFPSHPELAARHAYTPREMERFIAFAARHGMRVVPEIECLGHTAFITGVPRHAHLRDGVEGKWYSAIAPLQPEAQALLADLFADAARIFPDPWMHAGLDEVGFGAHPHTRRLLRKMKKHEIFAAHVRWVHGVITGLGKRMLMWGDHLLPPDPKHLSDLDTEAFSAQIADASPKDIIICDWHYQPKPDPSTTDFFLRKGFQVIACPAVGCWGSINHPRSWHLHNLRDFAAIAARRRDDGVIGMMNTVWTPWRYFTGTLLFGMAFGAHVQQTGGRTTKGFAARFVRDTFGLRKPDGVVRALELLNERALHVNTFARAVPYGLWELKDAKPEDLRACAAAEPAAREAERLLGRAAGAVTRNPGFFDELRFAARSHVLAAGRLPRFVAMSETLARGRALAKRGDRAGARLAFAELRDAVRREAASAREIHRDAVRRWGRRRFADDPKRDAQAKKLRFHDSLFPRLRCAAELLARLERQAARLARTGRGPFALPDLAGRMAATGAGKQEG